MWVYSQGNFSGDRSQMADIRYQMAGKNSKVRGLPAVDLPREKLSKSGVESLSTKDLIALLLRSGVKGKNVMELAREILKKFTLAQLAKVKLSDLISISGMGLTRASSIIAAFELNKRLEKEKKDLKPVLDTPLKVYKYVGDLHRSSREKFIAIYLDNRMRVIKRYHVSVGTVSASIVHPREVFKPAVEINASHVVIAHNHPSGDETPSDEDVKITEKLTGAGEIMGIPLIDHIIITSESYYSFKEHNKL